MDEKRQKALEFLRSQNDSSLLDKSNYTSPLNQDVMKVKGNQTMANATEPVTRIKNATQHIDTKTPMNTISGSAFKDKIARLRGLKSIANKIPMLGSVVGGIGAMLGSENASAAVPILNEAESVGPQQGSFDDRLEKGLLTEEEKRLLKTQMENR